MSRSRYGWSPVEILATTGGLGYIPFAPGTWGSLPGIPLAWLLRKIEGSFTTNTELFWPVSFLIKAGLLAVLCFIATAVIRRTEVLWGSHDDKSIVIDETVGQAFVLIWFDLSLLTMMLGFAFFRLYDIWKPGPIGWIDRSMKSPFGTLADDLVAGVLGALSLLTVGALSSWNVF